MEPLDTYWGEADTTWDLQRLYQDLSKAKGRMLTDLQKAMLRAALCSVTLREVAGKLNRGLKGLRTDLSCGLYRFIETLVWDRGIQHEGKIFWQQLPRLLALAGYEQRCLSTAQDILESISDSQPDSHQVRAIEIIEAVEKQRIDIRFKHLEATFPLAVAQQLEQQGDAAAKQQDYVAAIHFYRIPIEKNPEYASLLVKIAAAFDQLHQYADSVAIALEALSLVSDLNHISSLNGILGSAFHELAIHTQDELILRQALDYYQKSAIKCQGSNVLAAWNSFDLLAKFSQLKTAEADRYLRKAILAFCHFHDIAADPCSNFEQHRTKILQDARQIQLELSDPWLCEALAALPDDQ